MDTGELLTRWSVRLAVVLFFTALAIQCRAPRLHRITWAAGCAAYLLHVAFAFQYYHHWSHAEAYASTARQTREVVGLDWGGGLYFNYLFTTLWVADVILRWTGFQRSGGPPHPGGTAHVLRCAVHGFLGFIVFNATVVFATGFSRWLGFAGSIVLVLSYYRTWRTRADDANSPDGRSQLDRGDD